MKKEKVFISGKVSGLLYSQAKHNFDVAEECYRDLGYTVWNPTRHCNVTWSWLRCMVVCLWNLAKCDIVYFLPGWEDSRGSRIEHRWAKFLGKTIIYEYLNGKRFAVL